MEKREIAQPVKSKLEEVRKSFALPQGPSADEVTVLMRRILYAGGEVVERSGVDTSTARMLQKEHARATVALLRTTYPWWKQPPLRFVDITS